MSLLCNHTFPKVFLFYPVAVAIITCALILTSKSSNGGEPAGYITILIFSAPLILCIGMIFAIIGAFACQGNPGHTLWIATGVIFMILCLVLCTVPYAAYNSAAKSQ